MMTAKPDHEETVRQLARLSPSQSLHYWRARSLGPNHTREQAAFAEWFGLRATHARILAEIFCTEGEILSKVLAFKCGLSHRALFTAIPEVRRALGFGCIQAIPGRGYRMTEKGMEECRQALEEISV